VGFDGEIASMIEQSVEDIDGFARIGIHGDDVENAGPVRGEP
jgi:methyl coenzyme M reductase subunit D